MGEKMIKEGNPRSYRPGNRRGYYIYGKNFFILPNELWEKVSENEKVVFVLKGSGIYVSFDRKYLVPTLREPSDCGYQIQPEANFYALAIPDKPLSYLPEGIKTYVRYSKKLLKDKGIPAMELYKGVRKRWYSHIWYNLRSPFGSIVIPEKFRPYERGVAAHYIRQRDTQVAVPVTFYTRSAGSATKDLAIVAWFNSTVGLSFRYKERAWLGRASERMSGRQIDNMHILNVHNCDTKHLAELNERLMKLPSPLPDFEEQLKNPFYSGSGRSQLDRFLLEMVGVKRSKIDEYQDGCVRLVKEWIDMIKGIN